MYSVKYCTVVFLYNIARYSCIILNCSVHCTILCCYTVAMLQLTPHHYRSSLVAALGPQWQEAGEEILFRWFLLRKPVNQVCMVEWNNSYKHLFTGSVRAELRLPTNHYPPLSLTLCLAAYTARPVTPCTASTPCSLFSLFLGQCPGQEGIKREGNPKGGKSEWTLKDISIVLLVSLFGQVDLIRSVRELHLWFIAHYDAMFELYYLRAWWPD